MISVEQARAIVLDRCRPLPFARAPLDQALGRFLAEPVTSDIDLPPFDKALVDGYAVRSSDCVSEGLRSLTIGEEIPAGKTPTRPLAVGEAAVIMTGAPLPDGADAVVMHEKTRIGDDGRVLIPCPISAGEGCLKRGREMKAGQTVLRARDLLDAIKLGVLASVGQSTVTVAPRPRVIIIPTGDELVPVAERPGPGQIRETNSTVLGGLARSMDAEAIVHATVPDEPETLERAIGRALADRPDVLILCGGVSAGKRDLVPAALAANGVVTLFHKVRVKPGKPLLFGIATHGAPLPEPPDAVDESRIHDAAARLRPQDARTLVYGLPGNPVSGIVGFLLFVAPALLRMGLGSLMGESWCPPHEGLERARLAAPFRQRGDRPAYHPVSWDGADRQVTPLPWAGSSDLLSLAMADGFARFEAGDRDYETGEEVEILRLPVGGLFHYASRHGS